MSSHEPQCYHRQILPVGNNVLKMYLDDKSGKTN